MIDTDKRAFLEIMTMTGEIYNKKISTALLKMYFEALKQLSIADVENGIQKHLADTNQGGFFPKPSDIAKTGPYNKPRIEDRQALAAMRGLGGWVNLCNLSYEQLDWKKKEFFDLYETYEKAPLESLPSNLPGLVELQKHKAENNGGMKLISEALNNIKTTLDKGE